MVPFLAPLSLCSPGTLGLFPSLSCSHLNKLRVCFPSGVFYSGGKAPCELRLPTTRGQEGLFNYSLKMPFSVFKLASGILTKRSIMAKLLFDLQIIGILQGGDLISPF